MEIWKDIKDYEGLYQVSNLGRVKSLDRFNSRGFKIKGKILQIQNHQGYQSVKLYNNGNIRFLIHRLVAIAFLPNLENKETVNHKDFNRNNNNINNLEWKNQRENNTHYTNSLNTESKYTGVFLDKRDNTWFSSIKTNGVLKYLGRSKNEEDCAKMYQEELQKINNNNK